MKVTTDTLHKIIAELRIMKTMTDMMPQTQTAITMDEDDKRELDQIDLSEEIGDLNAAIEATFNKIHDVSRDIYKNAVDEREDYPDDSMHKRALWLDEVQMEASCLMTESDITEG
jgi:hypothetical protein